MTFDPLGSAAPHPDPLLNGDSAPITRVRSAHPPVLLLVIALVVAVGGGVLGLTSGSAALAFTGWLLAGPVTFGLLAWFQNRDLRVRATGAYSEPGWVRPLYWSCVSLAGVALLLCAWRLADWVGRQ